MNLSIFVLLGFTVGAVQRDPRSPKERRVRFETQRSRSCDVDARAHYRIPNFSTRVYRDSAVDEVAPGFCGGYGGNDPTVISKVQSLLYTNNKALLFKGQYWITFHDFAILSARKQIVSGINYRVRGYYYFDPNHIYEVEFYDPLRSQSGTGLELVRYKRLQIRGLEVANAEYARGESRRKSHRRH